MALQNAVIKRIEHKVSRQLGKPGQGRSSSEVTPGIFNGQMDRIFKNRPAHPCGPVACCAGKGAAINSGNDPA
jgi:hypothetical protein